MLFRKQPFSIGRKITSEKKVSVTRSMEKTFINLNIGTKIKRTVIIPCNSSEKAINRYSSLKFGMEKSL